MTNQQKIDAYLQRIGFTGKVSLDFDTLHTLQLNHLLHVPYENIDIVHGIPLSLEVDAIFDKVVTRRRGGYCFELNALFAWLLKNLGFNVKDYMGRFIINETGIPMRRHRLLGVTIGSEMYLADVGVGLVIPRKPMLIKPGIISEQNGEQWKFEVEPFYGYVLHELKEDGWRKLYSFTEEEQAEVDYVMPSFYCEKHPDSMFHVSYKIHIFTKDGRKSVAGNEIKLFSPSGVEVIIPQSEAEFHELLKLHFGINL